MLNHTIINDIGLLCNMKYLLKKINLAGKKSARHGKAVPSSILAYTFFCAEISLCFADSRKTTEE